MAKYNSKEQEALKLFNIESFKNIPKDKILAISSSLHKLDKEVALKVIEQFPTYKDAVCEIVSDYKEIAVKALDNSELSTKTFYEAKIQEMNILENELNRDDLSQEDRFDILDRISKVTDDIDKKDSEVRGFVYKVLSVIGVTVASVSLGLLTALGSSILKRDSISNNEDDEDDD